MGSWCEIAILKTDCCYPSSAPYQAKRRNFRPKRVAPRAPSFLRSNLRSQVIRATKQVKQQHCYSMPSFIAASPRSATARRARSIARTSTRSEHDHFASAAVSDRTGDFSSPNAPAEPRPFVHEFTRKAHRDTCCSRFLRRDAMLVHAIGVSPVEFSRESATPVRLFPTDFGRGLRAKASVLKFSLDSVAAVHLCISRHSRLREMSP